MRVLLDECLPHGLKKHLVPFDVVTVAEAGWAGSKNGELLRQAAGNVDVFITVDKNLVHQQNVKGLPFGRRPAGALSFTAPVPRLHRCS